MNALLLLSSLFHQCTAYASQNPQNLPETHLLVIEEMPYWFNELFICKPEIWNAVILALCLDHAFVSFQVLSRIRLWRIPSHNTALCSDHRSVSGM